MTTAAPTPAPAMGLKAARGMAWLLSQTAATRVINLVSQVVLAYLLLDSDFGLFALAEGAYMIAMVVQQGGVNEVLIRRHAEFRRLANPAAWFSLALATLAALGLVGAGAGIEFAADKPGVLLLTVALAPSLLFMAPMRVADAKLRIDMRFKLIAAITTAMTVFQVGVTIMLARMGFGAMSFALARPITEAVRLAVLWHAAHPPFRLTPELGLWGGLIGDNAQVLAAKIVLTIMQQTDRFVLGFFAAASVVGVYYFAYRLTFQVMQLFTGNLVGVLLPALSKLNAQPQRMLAGFVRSTRLLAIVGVPSAFLQAAAAEPAIHAVFPPQWEPAVPVVQLLSIGMAFRVVGSPAGSLMYAAGRYRAVLVVNTIYAVVFLAMLALGAWLGGLVGLAVAASLFFGLLGPLHMYVAIRPLGGTADDVLRVYAAPVAASAAATAAAWAASSLVPADAPLRDWARMGAVAVVGTAVYVPLITLFAPELVRDLIDTARKLVGRGAPPPAVPPERPAPAPVPE